MELKQTMTQSLIENQKATVHSGNYSSGFFHTYKSMNLDNYEREIQVYLPSDYNSTENSYPVIYMNDGQTAFEPGGVAPWSWEVAKTLNELYATDSIQKVIIVAIYPIDRTFEYLKVRKYKEFDGTIIKKGGGLNLYTDYVSHQLKPFIDRNYRTKPEAENTSIVGSSFGGLAAFYISTTRSMYFGSAGILSPSFWVGTRIRKTTFLNTEFMRDALEHLKRSKKLPKLWIDWGSSERKIAKRVPRVVKFLTKKLKYKEGTNLFVHEDHIGHHDERAWEYRFRLLLIQLYGKHIKAD